jgi:DNA-binding transcriptional MerR regulator
MIDSYTSSQVSERTCLTPRQLQWWDEQGIVVPARQGHRRLYSTKDLAELAILSDLRRRGFSLQRIRKMIDLLRHEFGYRLAELLSRGPGLHLLTDGESIFLCDSERGVIDLLRDTQQPLLAICIGPMLERVLAKAPAPAAGAALHATYPLPDEAPAAGAASVAAYPSSAQLISQAPKKASQPVRAATAARATVRP